MTVAWVQPDESVHRIPSHEELAGLRRTAQRLRANRQISPALEIEAVIEMGEGLADAHKRRLEELKPHLDHMP